MAAASGVRPGNRDDRDVVRRLPLPTGYGGFHRTADRHICRRGQNWGETSAERWMIIKLAREKTYDELH